MVTFGCSFMYSSYRPASLKPNVPKRPIVIVTGVLSCEGDAGVLADAAVLEDELPDAFGEAVFPLDDEQPASASAATTAAPTSACRLLRAMNMNPPVSPQARARCERTPTERSEANCGHVPTADR